MSLPRLAGALALLLLWSTPDRATAQELAFVDSPYQVTPELRSSLERHRYFSTEDPADRALRSRRRWRHAWLASWAAYAAVNVLDLHSSLGKRELNPMLRGADGSISVGKAAAFKGGLGGALFTLQYLTIQRNPHKNYYKPFTFVTGAAAGTFGAVAVKNYDVPRTRP